MTTATQPITTTQVYRVYIKATAKVIWDAITKPEWTNRYGYTGFTVIHDLEGAPRLAALVSGAFEDAGGGGGGGHAWVLSDLKSLLETGKTLAG